MFFSSIFFLFAGFVQITQATKKVSYIDKERNNIPLMEMQSQPLLVRQPSRYKLTGTGLKCRQPGGRRTYVQRVWLRQHRSQ